MPHLQFELSRPVEESEADALTEWVTELYAEVMETGTGHIAVTIRDDATVALGRAGEEPCAVLDADVRAGRSLDQRRELAATVIDELADRWGIPAENVYVVYTEHPGEDFVLSEGPLDSWNGSEASDDHSTNR